MLKYITIVFLILLSVSCKKETTTPIVPPVVTPVAEFTLLDALGNCNSSTVEGSYIAGTPLNTDNRVVLHANVITPGTYTIVLSSGNGYLFSASGTFVASGQQSLILHGSGTPGYGAIDNFSITRQSVICSFTVTVLSAVVDASGDNDQMYFGNPTNAAGIIDSVNNLLMRRTYNALSYNRDKGIPNWVSWHLSASDVGDALRQDDFRPDNSLPAGWYQVSPTSYSSSGFDKGHNTPSGDRTSTVEANSSTFLMTNMIPQAPVNNQVVWANLEDSLRRLATMGYELYIIMGTYGAGGTGNNGFATSIDGGMVTVPANIWKVAVILPNGNNDSSRVDAGTRIIAVDIPNTNDVFSNWKNYRVSVDAIEAATGYNLLTRLPEILQGVVEAQVDHL